jgi:hypothetical protein
MAGENVDSTGNTTANQELLELMAISQLVSWSRYNWADNYSSLNTDVKHVVMEYLARFIGSALISYNMAGFTSRIEAENMLNIHLFRMRELQKLFEDQKWVTYAQGA